MAAPFAPARAQPDSEIRRPEASRRAVRLFDFEPSPREVFDLPRFWDMAQDREASPRPGFPRWNHAALDFDSPAFRGTGTLRLSTTGGSACLRLEAGVIPVFPNTDYLVTAMVRADGLERARAAVIVRYLDRANQPIPGAEARTDLLRAGPWRQVWATLPAGVPGAAFIQIDLVILQPERFQRATLGPHQVWTEDRSAAAWFDDVSVMQMPSVKLATQESTNIIEAPARPHVEVSIRDLTGEALVADLVAIDAEGKEVDRQRRDVPGGRTAWTWEPNLPAYGWYAVRLDLTAGSFKVGVLDTRLGWVAPAPKGIDASDRARFTLISPSMPTLGAAWLAQMARAGGFGTVTLPAWTQDLTVQGTTARALAMRPDIRTLTDAGLTVALALDEFPAELTSVARLATSDAVAGLQSPAETWTPYLNPLLDRFGQTVRRWWIGKPEAVLPTTGLDAAAAALREQLVKLVPGPQVVAPWPIDAAPPTMGAGVGEIAAFVPWTTRSDSIRSLLDAWAATGKPLTLVLEPLPSSSFSPMDRAVELARRVIEGWAGPLEAKDAPPVRVALVSPWEMSADHAPTPTVEMIANRLLSERLCGRRVVGELSTREGVRCYVLASPTHIVDVPGAIVLWATEPGGLAAPLDVYLGEGNVRAIDLFGNERPIQRLGGDATHPTTHRVPIAEAPLFVEGVDVELAQLVASFRTEPGSISASAGEHQLDLVLRNPWPTRIDGRISVLEPGGLSSDDGTRDRSWRISPRVSNFSIGPGREGRIPLAVAFGPLEEAGRKEVVADLTVEGRGLGTIRLRTSFDINLADVRMDLSYRWLPEGVGTDLMVEARVTNMGKAPATLLLSAVAPPEAGFRRDRASISELEPGQTAVRRFAFPGARELLRGQKITVGAQDNRTKARLNKAIVVE
ncbi:MAG: hypothetical protein ACKVW3_06185 [Phycisphaerales bacterium]